MEKHYKSSPPGNDSGGWKRNIKLFLTITCLMIFAGQITSARSVFTTSYESAWATTQNTFSLMNVQNSTANFEVDEVCTWTVHVWEDYWGDEVEWELRDSGGAVLLSGGPYGSTYDDTQSTTAEGPLTFWITNDGTFGDNEANYEVSIENGVIITGQMPNGGATYEFTDLNCSDEAIAECSGTPEGGTATVNPDSGQSGSTANFAVTGYSTGDLGLTYDWEYSVNGGEWQSVGTGSDDVDFTLTGEHGDVFTVRYAVTCSHSGETGYSNILVFTIDNSNCTPSFSSSSDYIDGFVLEDIENIGSGFSPGGYGDYTAMSTALGAGQDYTASLTSSSGGGTHAAAVWIDFNNDGTFDVSEKVGYTNGIGASQTVDIALTIPADALAGEHRMRVLYQFNVTGENLDPCVSASYGEGEDYTVNIILLDGCTEANAGTVEGPESVCASTEFTLTADGASALEAGLSGQWQSSADGELWEDIDGETAATLTTSIEEATWFRYTMSCENDPDNPDTSNEVHVTLKPDTECYCIPSSNNIEPITYVKLEEIDNTSSADTSSPAYEDFTDMIASVTPGETYTITLKGNTDGGWTNYFTIFIDYNQNGEFESTEVETAGSISNSTGTDDMELTYDIQIPMDATPGLTRLRIRKNFSTAYLDPCTTNGYGQTEDYTINIIPLDGCTEANAGTVEGPESVCASTEFTLTADGASALEAGLCGQWQSSADGELWEDIDGETAATLTTSIEEATWFRYTMSCENDPDNPDTSNEVHVTLKPVTECHCVPSTSSGATHYINDFTTTGGTVNISNPSGASPEGYTDFTGIPGLTVVQGSDIGYSIGVSGGSTYSRSIWIDYNQDGVFDATERVAFTGYTSPPLIGNFTISMDALTGTTKMRIIAAFSPSDPNDPCVNSGSGEYEDYLITIEAIEQCSGQPDAGIANSPATVGVGETYTVSATDYSIGAGISYQWQSNTDGAGWIDEGEALTAYQNYTATAPETNATQIQWRLMVTCDAALETPSFSEVSTTETIIIYCTPSFSSTSDYITSFGLANLQNPDSGFSTGGYGDFTSMAPANLFEGIESTVNVSTSSGVGGHGLAVWIDYNNNGTFESSELVGTLNSVLQDSDVSIDFTPPVGSSGLHRMRVIYQWSTLGSAINPCVSASWGEAEDYMVNIAPQPECPDLTEAPANVTFDDSVCEEGCEVGGGVIYEPADITIDSISGACPTGSFLEFSTDNGVTWSTDMPEYNQTESMTITTRCTCEIDNTVFSPSSEPVTTNPGSCEMPDAPVIIISDNVCPSTEGSISADAVGEGFTLEWSTDMENWTMAAPAYSDTSFTVYARIVNDTTGCTSEIAEAATAPQDCSAFCSGTPEGGIAMATPNSGEPNSTYSVMASGYAQGIGLEYAWYFSLDNGSNWELYGSSADSYFDLEDLTAPAGYDTEIRWRLGVYCEFSESTGWSTDAVFTTNSEPAPTCPELAEAPANVSFEDSVCQEGCEVSGGMIYAPSSEAPTDAHIEYSTDGGTTWSTALPVYNQTESMSIITRYVCDLDASVVSPSSEAVTTNPGSCEMPDAPVIIISDNVCPSTEGSISAEAAGEGFTLEWSTDMENWTLTAPAYSDTGFTVYARIVNDTTGCTSEIAEATTAPQECEEGCTDPKVYMSAGNTKTALYTLDENFNRTMVGSTSAYRYNALGLNPVDNYLYAMVTYTNQMLKIDPATGEVTNLGAVSGLPSGDFVSATFDLDGNYYVYEYGSTGVIYKIALAGDGTVTAINLSTTIASYDVAYNPEDGMLYGVYRNGRLYKINPETGVVTRFGFANQPNSSFGSAYIADNHLIAMRNTNGEMVAFDLSTGAGTLIGQTAVLLNNDMASCPGMSSGKAISGESYRFAYQPNPVRDMLYISTNREIESIDVYNLTNQKVLSIRSTEALHGEVNVNSLPQGVYVVRAVLKGGQVETFKIVKK